jgi:hypothetical protein
MSLPPMRTAVRETTARAPSICHSLEENASLASSFAGKVGMSILAIGGGHGVAAKLADSLQGQASSLSAVIGEDSGHFVPEGAPDLFLRSGREILGELRRDNRPLQCKLRPLVASAVVENRCPARTHLRRPPRMATAPHCLPEGDFARGDVLVQDDREAIAAHSSQLADCVNLSSMAAARSAVLD